MSKERGWYIAHHPEVPHSFLRQKDAAKLQEWRKRDWKMFPGTPVIVDVTNEIEAALAQGIPLHRETPRRFVPPDELLFEPLLTPHDPMRAAVELLEWQHAKAMAATNDALIAGDDVAGLMRHEADLRIQLEHARLDERIGKMRDWYPAMENLTPNTLMRFYELLEDIFSILCNLSKLTPIEQDIPTLLVSRGVDPVVFEEGYKRWEARSKVLYPNRPGWNTVGVFRH